MPETNERRENSERGLAGNVSRRRVLEATTVVASAVGFSGLALGRQPTSYRLGGQADGWQGQSPSQIEGNQNPVLEFRIDAEYEITWENLDGEPHNIAILDSNGNVIKKTQNLSQQGQTQTITFTANSNMTQYVCQTHPNSMIGDINVGGGGGQTVGENVTSLPEGTGTTGKAATAEQGGGQPTTGGGTPTGGTTSATTVAGPAETTGGEEETTPEPGEQERTGNGGGQPGFGIFAALAAVLGGAYLRYRDSVEE